MDSRIIQDDSVIYLITQDGASFFLIRVSFSTNTVISRRRLPDAYLIQNKGGRSHIL